MELPKILKKGEVARLFPVIAETGKEQRATSILLSVLSAMPALANALLSQLGQRIGSRTNVNTFVEVVLKNETDSAKGDRPDGLIQIITGKRSWSALVEVKIGKSELEADQIERYLRLAKENDVDAVVTISNQFAAIPSHHPVVIQKGLTRKVDLFHFSWRAILTEAVLMHEQSALSDPEQAFLLREFVRFLSHNSAGVTGFTSMPKEWTTAVDRIQAGGSINKTDGLIIVNAWHQELRDLSLLMSRIISCPVNVKMPRVHASDAEKRAADGIQQLFEEKTLSAKLEIPNTASPIKVQADLMSRSIRISMRVDSPKDKKTTKARINWLLRQIKNVELDNVYVGIIWASRASNTVFPLTDFRGDSTKIDEIVSGSEIASFEVTLTSDSARRFAGIRTFIDDIEGLAPRFYEEIGQHLESWQPQPPKPKHTFKMDSDILPENNQREELAVEITKMPAAGNAHSELLEIPPFLIRDVG